MFSRFAVHSNEISAGQEESRDHSTSLALSPESYIHYLLFSIPLPTPNQCIVIPNVPAVTRRQSTSNVLILQRPSSFTELPLFEYDIGQVISLLGVDGLIQLWTCLLLESQVLIHSQGTATNLKSHFFFVFKLNAINLILFAIRSRSFDAGG